MFSEFLTLQSLENTIRQIHFLLGTSLHTAHLISMSTKTPPVTAAGFEKVFAGSGTKHPRRVYRLQYAADWREVAWAALERKKLGGALRCAIEALSAGYREVLFLHDVKNLTTAEAAWVLGITVPAARSRLLKARMQVRDALASGLSPKPGEKNSDQGNSCSHEIPCNFRVPAPQNSFSLA